VKTNLIMSLSMVFAHGPKNRDLTLKVSAVSRAGHLPDGVSAKFVNYTVDSNVYEGYVAYPTTSSRSELPAMVIVHQWYGLGEYEMHRAEEAAENGYYAFAIDVYGYGQRATDNSEAGALAGAARSDEAKLVMIAEGGVDQLKPGGVLENEGPSINQSAIVSFGYCFGGGVLLMMGRDGTDLFGMSVFHASFPDLTSGWSSPDVKVMAHHGQLDFAGDDGLNSLHDALTTGNVSVWQTAYYGNQAHGFSDFLNAAYDPLSASQSHDSAYAFFANTLALSDCQDSTSWYKKNDPSKNCAWVATFTKRCGVKGFDNSLASDACQLSCGSC